ncbi:hypothetical protein [Enterobacter sp. CPE_E1241]|uniref:hypothetical protein n=1 Tax=Enterobacter sp. CPE_E1241 TaxID=3376801 RepID=UPI003890FB58
MNNQIVFVNGKSKCGCVMNYSDGSGEYSDVHEITTCAAHSQNETIKEVSDMAKELRFYGASDDLFECEGAIREEIGCFNKPGIYHLKSAEGELLVVGYYLDSGLWSIGVSQVAENIPLPAWPVTYSIHECGYSPLVTIEVPNDVTLAELCEEA